MYDGGAFGGYTRWVVVFPTIFVVFIVLHHDTAAGIHRKQRRRCPATLRSCGPLLRRDRV